MLDIFFGSANYPVFIIKIIEVLKSGSHLPKEFVSFASMISLLKVLKNALYLILKASLSIFQRVTFSFFKKVLIYFFFKKFDDSALKIMQICTYFTENVY